MTKQEVSLMLGVIQTAYPNFQKSGNIGDVINLWYEFFCDEPAEIIKYALRQHIAASQFPPTIAEILKLAESKKWALYAEHESLQTLGFSSSFSEKHLPRGITRQRKANLSGLDQQILRLKEEKER